MGSPGCPILGGLISTSDGWWIGVLRIGCDAFSNSVSDVGSSVCGGSLEMPAAGKMIQSRKV